MCGFRKVDNSKFFIIIIVVSACLIFYGNTIPNKYAWDDYVVITLNKFTKKGIDGIPGIFKYDSFVGAFGPDLKNVQTTGGRYRPLSIATFALEYQFFGENPHISHVNNIIFFILTSLFLYLVLSKIFRQYYNKDDFLDFPLIATLIFIAHPVHTEVIANIKGRDEILALAGSLIATLYSLKYIDSKKIIYLIWSFFFFSLALFSKENAVTFLAIVPLSIYFYKKEKWNNYLYTILPLVLATIFYMGIRQLVIGKESVSPSNFFNDPFFYATHSEKYATIFYTLGMYIKLLFFPHPLTADYCPYQIKLVYWNNIISVISLIFYLLLIIYGLWNLSKKSVISYGILFYLITLSLVSNLIFPLGYTFMNERFIFLPSIGFVIIIAWLISNKFYPFVKSNYIKISLILIILVLCFIKTYSRNKAWKDDFTLYTTDVKTSSNSVRNNTVACVALLLEADKIKDSALIKKYRTEALEYDKKSLSIFVHDCPIAVFHSGSAYVDAIITLGDGYAKNNMKDSALLCYKKAFLLKPEMSEIIFNKVEMIMKNINDVDFKFKNYFDFFKMAPDNFDINYKMGYLYARYRNDNYKAIYYLNRAIAINPNDFTTFLGLGISYRKLCDYSKSAYYLEIAVNKTLDKLPVLNNLLITYSLAGNQKKRIEVQKKIEELKQGNRKPILL